MFPEYWPFLAEHRLFHQKPIPVDIGPWDQRI